MARPRVEIDKEQFEKLCSLQCTLDEIAGWFGCSQDTIERWCKRELDGSFADTYKKYSVQGKISLRRIQFKQAEKSTAMAIWLGKQWLGQKDQIVTTSEDTIKTAEEILVRIRDVSEAEARDGNSAY